MELKTYKSYEDLFDADGIAILSVGEMCLVDEGFDEVTLYFRNDVDAYVKSFETNPCSVACSNCTSCYAVYFAAAYEEVVTAQFPPILHRVAEMLDIQNANHKVITGNPVTFYRGDLIT